MTPSAAPRARPKPSVRSVPAGHPGQRGGRPARRLPGRASYLLAGLALLSGLAPPGAAQQAPAAGVAPGLDRADLDPTADFCREPYRFANGGWLDRTAIPADRSGWGAGSEVRARNDALLRKVLEDLGGPAAPAEPVGRLLASFWCACNDAPGRERRGAAGLASWLARIEAAPSGRELLVISGELAGQGIDTLFSLAAEPDADTNDVVLPWFFQGGLGLPDRDDYLEDDAASVALRRAYVGHVAAMFALVGEEPEQAAEDAATVMRVETLLARISVDRVALRDPHAVWNPMSVIQANALCPGLDLADWSAAAGLSRLPARINLATPSFFVELGRALDALPVEDWRCHQRWQLLSAAAPELSDAFVAEDFRFRGAVLLGAREPLPRWKRCLDLVDRLLGEALGQLYVARAFPPESKAAAVEMVGDLKAAMRQRLETLDWMGEDTRREALTKLDRLGSKIGYPDRWRDWSGLALSRDDHLGNVLAAGRFEVARQLAKVGLPPDRDEWLMAPQAVNAYYNPQLNEIVFPAGILQPPFFSGTQDAALNYGGMGAIIGHEITHGFDDQGSRFDATGALRNWWTDEDDAEFRRRADALVAQYDGYVAVGDEHVNGRLTLGENIADLGGLRIAWAALLRKLERDGAPSPERLDGFTPAQRFFLAYLRSWRAELRPEALRNMVRTNEHSPPFFRATGVLANMPEAFAAFGCDDAPALRPPGERVLIW